MRENTKAMQGSNSEQGKGRKGDYHRHDGEEPERRLQVQGNTAVLRYADDGFGHG